MSYEPYYKNGWQAGEEGGTPITPAALAHMDEGIAAALPVTGGTLIGILQLTEGVHYGTTLLTSATKGQLFFKKVT